MVIKASEEGCERASDVGPRVPVEHLDERLDSELVPGRIPGLPQSIGAEEQGATGLERDGSLGLEERVLEDAGRHRPRGRSRGRSRRRSRRRSRGARAEETTP